MELGFSDMFAVHNVQDAAHLDTAKLLLNNGFDVSEAEILLDQRVMRNAGQEYASIAIDLKQQGYDTDSITSSWEVLDKAIDITADILSTKNKGGMERLIKAPDDFESVYKFYTENPEVIEALKEMPEAQRRQTLASCQEGDLRNAGLLTMSEQPNGTKGEFSNIPGREFYNPQYMEKLDKLHSAFMSGNYEETYCPRFASDADALQSLKIGDVFQVDGQDYISIKLPNGEAEQLHISMDTYFKLFNPVDDLSIAQRGNGDCYFISGVDARFNNPMTRADILRSFEEIGDGIINVNLQTDSGVFRNTYDSTDITPFINSTDDVAIGPRGLQMLEDAQGYVRMSEVDYYTQQQGVVNDMIEEFNRNGDSWNDAEKATFFGKLNEENSYLLQHKNDSAVRKYQNESFDFKNDPIGSATQLREGGGAVEASNRFGVKATRCGSEDMVNWFNNTDESVWENFIFNGGTKGTADTDLIDSKNGLAGHHVYQIIPFKAESGDMQFQIINPHDTRFIKIIDADTLIKDFDVITSTHLQ